MPLSVLQGLGEIAFCAVAANQQVRGFGTRLMNHTKAMARDHDGLTHFLTYADNNAVGYFTKQVHHTCSGTQLTPADRGEQQHMCFVLCGQ